MFPLSGQNKPDIDGELREEIGAGKEHPDVN